MRIGRRRFLEIAAAAALTGCASMIVTPVTPEAGRVRLMLRNHPRLTEPRGALMIRPVGSDNTIYVLTLDDGGFAAVSPICKHQGCIVDIAGPRLECPCHGSMYGRDGRVLRGPTELPLDLYPVDVSTDGVLTIHLDRAI
jgi:cytochrome b6-f complex iron-sulfur subunit